MAQRIQVLLTCDLDESDDDVQTVHFGYDGHEYAIELCAKDREEFAGFMEAWSVAARRESSRSGSGNRRAAPKAPARSAADELAQVREWAKANGYNVKDRGRISAEIREAYAAAHG